MASLAASATMSAQETTPGQTASSTALAVSMTSKPPSDPFGPASFSAVLPTVESISSDASHPYVHESARRPSTTTMREQSVSVRA
jgi:hypothetical protein